MRIRVLGPVTAIAGGTGVPLGGPKPRTLLALLAMHAGSVVSFDRVVDALWGDRPPGQARAAIYTYVSALRRALPIVRRNSGYLLAVDDIDLHAFDSLVGEGRLAAAGGAFAQAAGCFEAALAQWNGPPLGGAQGDWAEHERVRLDELRLAAFEDLVDARLALGRAEALVSELVAAVAEHPLRERLRGQLMLALHATGRQADALACYREGRDLLTDEHGVEPGPALRAVHDRVLQNDEPAPMSRPSQLPFDIADFTGRHTYVQQIRAAVADESTTRLCAVYGKPGAGKSTLIRHVAHQVRDDFPDGQLYVSMRAVGNDTDGTLGAFLRALGVATVPTCRLEREHLYRTLLADRRVLVVLDDVAHERHVRALLPGGRHCAALISSRERLDALPGAVQVDLPVFELTEALDLLTEVVGPQRTEVEPGAAAEIVRLCGRLPLAVRIAGGRLAARPHWPLNRLAERLSHRRQVLRELMLGDLEVRGSIELSYEGLAERERTALRRLALLDVSSFSSGLVGPLLDTDADTSERVVEQLVDAQLLDLVTGDGRLRYEIHELVGALARERGAAEESLPATREVATRVAEFLLTHVREAKEQTRFVERLGELDLTALATELATTLCSAHFSVRNLFGPWWRTHQAVLVAAQRCGDRLSEARTLFGLGWLRYEEDRFDEAADYYEQALTVFGLVTDEASVRGTARTRLALSTVQRDRGRLKESRRSLELVLAGLDETDDLHAEALHALGRVLTDLGDLVAAENACTGAVIAYRARRDRRNGALAQRSLGLVHRAAGRLDEAARLAEEALTTLRALGDRLMAAYAAQSLAKVRIRQGKGEQVRGDLLDRLSVCTTMRDGFGQALMLRTLGELEAAAGRREQARDYFGRALVQWSSLELPVWRARTLRDLAAVVGEPAFEAEAQELFARHGCREAGETAVFQVI
ncbi:tetratricopeptide repeat protein [Lentzea alba]|uniref:AfsR/SARP family transcriptional regulator n=1 Tax=Lentzea alba TaxID=2714351 RepID=UPI0039BFC00C